MKLGTFILLIPIATALPGFSSAPIWLSSFQQTLKNFIENPLRRSAVPQFILDARHPWTLANQRKLERLPSAAAFLCSVPDSESQESTGIESEKDAAGLEIPADLFDKLRINNHREGISSPGWPNALERLGEIRRCQRALKQAKMFEVELYMRRKKHSDLSLKGVEPSPPPERLLTLAGDVLASMTNLETLKWGIRQEDTHLFEGAFRSRNLTLPSVKRLEPGPSSHYLVGMCPNLEALESGGRYVWYQGHLPDKRDWGFMLIQAARATPKLKRFAMVNGYVGWTTSLVSEVVKSMPQIESLGLLGALEEEIDCTEHETGDSGKLKAVMDVLIGLENLTHLDLPQPWGLGLGFNGESGCEDDNFSEEGRMCLRQGTKEGAEATEKGGDIVVANLPHLTSFSIGGEKAHITRTEEGVVKVTWPWTGRIDEWSMEVVSERFNFGDVEYGSM